MSFEFAKHRTSSNEKARSMRIAGAGTTKAGQTVKVFSLFRGSTETKMTGTTRKNHGSGK